MTGNSIWISQINSSEYVATGIDAKALVVITRPEAVAAKSFRNLPQVNVLAVDQLNTYDVVWADTVVFSAAALDVATGGTSYEVAEDDFVREDDEGSGS